VFTPVTTIRIAESDEDLRRVSAVLLQLRPAFDRDSLVERIKEQMGSGYRVAFEESAGEVLCVAGFVVGRKLAWGKHVYVDDLVTADTRRSQGAGARMMEWLKRFAREQGCSQLHLDSGVQRFGAHRFYLREGFDITSHHFAVTDLGAEQ
jgi:GNAT superfamily N-acetyltransferase